MKKKHRDITVGGVKYAWIAEEHTISSLTKVKLFKDKKPWFTVNTIGTVTPGDVKNFINIQLKREV